MAWNKFDELCDPLTFPTLDYCAIYYGAILTKTSKAGARMIEVLASHSELILFRNFSIVMTSILYAGKRKSFSFIFNTQKTSFLELIKLWKMVMNFLPNAHLLRFSQRQIIVENSIMLEG